MLKRTAFFPPPRLVACRILVPRPRFEPVCPLQWKRGVLTAGLLGKPRTASSFHMKCSLSHEEEDCPRGTEYKPSIKEADERK